MAETNFKPEFNVFKTESDAFNSITENHDLIRKNDIRRLFPITSRPNVRVNTSAVYDENISEPGFLKH